jgi:hypothetical protein
MSALELTEATELIDTPAAKGGVRFSEDEVNNIQQLAGSLPFFVQATAAKWFQRKRTGSEPEPKAIRQQLAADLAPYFDQWWRNFTTCERTTLLAVAGERPLSELNYPAIELDAIVRRLHGYGLLYKADTAWFINGRIFHTWLRQYAQVEPAESVTVTPYSGADLARIRHALVDSFDLDELRTLCFDLGMDFESLPGQSKPAKAREMVNYWRNRHDLGPLTDAIRLERGNII